MRKEKKENCGWFFFNYSVLLTEYLGHNSLKTYSIDHEDKNYSLCCTFIFKKKKKIILKHQILVIA